MKQLLKKIQKLQGVELQTTLEQLCNKHKEQFVRLLTKCEFISHIVRQCPELFDSVESMAQTHGKSLIPNTLGEAYYIMQEIVFCRVIGDGCVIFCKSAILALVEKFGVESVIGVFYNMHSFGLLPLHVEFLHELSPQISEEIANTIGNKKLIMFIKDL